MADAVSAVLTKYINPVKGWQPRYVELNTGSGLFTTCHCDALGIPERATTTIIDIRGATAQLETTEPTFTVACVDGTKVTLRCANGQERTFWVDMLGNVGVRQGAAPSGGGGGQMGGGGSFGGLLGRGRKAAAAAAAAASQVGGSELMGEAYKMAGAGVAGVAAVAKAATYSTHDIGGMQIQIGAQLAEGGYSFVHFAEEVGTGRQFAVKRVVMMGGEANKNAKWEVDVLRKLQGHKNIMKMFSHGTMRLKRDGCTEMVMVCELCDGGHLYDHYVKMGGNVPEERLIDLFHQCCEGVSHLHSQHPPLAHRDVKIENFLLQGDTVKLCDFGSCTAGGKVYESRKDILDEEEIIQKYSTMMYRAPEMVDLYSGQLVSELVDIWALGCTLFTMAYGKHPFGDAGTLHILSGKYTIPDSLKYSERIPAIVGHMLVKKVVERPTVFQSMEFIRTGKGAGGGGGGGTRPAAAAAPRGAAAGAAPQQRRAPAKVVTIDDDFDPRTAAAAPGAAPAGGGGGGGLFGMLDWQDDSASPAPAPASAASSGAFDAGALSGEEDGEDGAFEADFDASFAEPAPAPAPKAAASRPAAGGALFGMLEWQDDKPKAGAMPSGGSGGAPLQLSGGGEFKPSFDDSAFDPPAAPAPVGAAGHARAAADREQQQRDYGSYGGVSLEASLGDGFDAVSAGSPSPRDDPSPAGPGGDDFFGEDDPFAAAPVPAPAPMTLAPTLSAQDDFFGSDPFADAGAPPAQSPPAMSTRGGSSPVDDFFGVSAPAAPAGSALAGMMPGAAQSPPPDASTPMATMMPMATMVPTSSASSMVGTPKIGMPPGPPKKTGSAFDSLSWS